MHAYILIVAPILFVSISFFPSESAATEISRQQSQENPPVLGELVKIEANVLTVKDPDGNERQLTIDHQTTKVGALDRGVYVQAWVLPDGRTESIVAFRTNRQTERELSEQLSQPRP